MGLFNLSFVELVMISGLALALKAYRMRGRWREQEELLVREKLESELKFLKAQINPHFLFNTLNNIYALARKQSADTADAVLKLSKLMRFMLFESRQDSIPLEEELRLIDDYIELERLRYGSKLQLELNRSIDDPSARVAPLLLIHFVENAFKHGAGESRFGVRIKINFVLKQGVLTASIINSVEDHEINNKPGIGLANIRRQLELLYPKHSLDLQRTNNEFHVQLTIPLYDERN
jgi:LytS/YehU family sensor histidine kinase